MSTSRRHLLLCASILGVGTLSGTAFAASTTQPEHRSHKAVHHKATTSTAAAKTARPAVAAPVAASSVAVPVATTTPAFSSRRRAEVLEAQGVSGGSERMVVTGSALASSNNQNANPVQIVTAKQIQQTGATTLSDFFARIPSIGGTGTNNSETNGTGGASCTDIRNLGSNRVLVLIDGKRATLNGQTNCIDLNALPVQQIASVEILKDGGSELYGADAVSGVINIKMRHDLSDGNITIRGGITGHGDNDTGMISAYKGWNFDHDKGNLTLFGQYMTQGGVLQRNRGWANPVQLTDNPVGSGGETFGSGYSNYTHVQNSTTNLNAAVAPDGKTVSTWGASNRYPYGEHQSLINQLQNSSLSGDFHYQFNRHANLYSNVMYSHRTSSSYMAAEPFDGSVPPSTLPSVLTVPANDPNNPFGQDVDITKRLTELGDRRDENATDTVTAKVGVNGAIAYGWDYDVSYTYGSNMSTDHLENVGSYTNLLNAYGLQQVDPSNSASALVYNPSVCPSFGCSNPFGTMGKQAASYVNYNTNTHSHYQLRDWNLRINNNHVTTMPWKGGGDLGMAFGFEHRGEQLTNTPDELISSGQSLTNTVLPTSGGFDVTEGYAEAKATLLKNVFLAKDLTIDAQGRASGYSTTSDTAKNWKASINWAPTQDIRFRGTIGTSYRQPNVYELYGGQSLSYNLANDPCDAAQVGTYGAASATVAATCAKQGINTSTFHQSGTGQVPTLGGGNAHLAPEIGRTYTFGTIITPRWIPNLSISGEFWHYSVNHTISALPTQYILDGCYTGTNSSLCNTVNRLANGQINTVSATNQNTGALHESGVDFDFDYHIRVARHDILSVSNNFQYLLNYTQQLVPGGAFTNYTGALLYAGGPNNANASYGIPRVRDYATFGWTHGAFTATYMMQFIGGMRWNDQSEFLASATAGRYKTPMMIEQDLTLAYRWKKWNFESGINNITNKKPPFVASGVDNSAGATYGSFYQGRYFFLQAGMNF